MAAFKAHGAMTITLEREPSVNAPIQLELWIIHHSKRKIHCQTNHEEAQSINIPLIVSPYEKRYKNKDKMTRKESKKKPREYVGKETR